MGILAGALRGLGTYMVDEAKAQRDAALETLRQQTAAQNAQVLAGVEHNYREAEQTHGAEVTGQQTRQTLRLSEDAATQARRETFSHEDTSREDTQHFQVMLNNIQHDNRLSEEQARIAAESAAQFQREGQTVSGYQITRDGQLVFFNQQGNRLSHSRPGVYEPPDQQHASSRHHGAAPAAAPAAQPMGAAATPNDQQVLARFGPVVDQTYGTLDPATRLQRARELAQRYGQ